MDLAAAFSEMPFVDLLGIEIVDADDGRATARLPMREALSSSPETPVAHGGVTSALADTVGGAAVISLHRDVTPTVDVRVDYLAPATTDLRAEAEVLRYGGSVAVADVDVFDADDAHVAAARGVYKTGGREGETAWSAGPATGLRDEG